ncbi:MAG: hypothetical protein MR303_12145 [Emergencia sp.]|nr:hypothetical protein [Emergencia sp.]
MNKSTTSMFAVLVIVSLLASAFAAYDIFWKETVKEKEMGKLENGEVFSMRTNKKLVSGVANEANHSIVLSIRYNKNRNRTFEWQIKDYPTEKFAPEEESFWHDVIDYAEKRITEASVIEVRHFLL